MKGIIVLDNVPENCRNINGDKENGCPFGGMVCKITNEDVMHHVSDETKPDWCPIKEIPPKMEELKCPHSLADFERKGFARGWNVLIDKIESLCKTTDTNNEIEHN